MGESHRGVNPSECAVIVAVIFATPVEVVEDQFLVLDLTLTSLHEIISLLELTGQIWGLVRCLLAQVDLQLVAK